MTLFEWLLIGHLVGDFLLQTNWMAANKASNYLALFSHAAVYTASVSVLAFLAGGISLKAVALVFLSHALLDRRGFVHYWARVVNKADDLAWFKVVSDQCWHLIVLAIATRL